MNIKHVHGRLVRDPELSRGSEPNKDRVKFTVASSRRFGDETDFIDCVMFGKRADVIDKYFRKGSEIYLYGEDQDRTYEDKNGVKRKAHSVMVLDFEFCGSKSDGSTTKPEGPEPNFEEVEEDIPF